MCGIAGFIAKPGAVPLKRVPAALDKLEHRGPDDRGWLCYGCGHVELGREWKTPAFAPELIFLHRRLSILDLAETGWQPMATPDGRYFIVFNGEIYNYLELRQELEGWGHEFRSHSDTEVLLAAYAQWGTEALPRLVGMFAFAILDTVSRKVFLARDFFGIKPLYYHSSNGSFVFASEIKALLELAPMRLHVNPERLLLYLRHGVCDHGSETLLEGIHQLPAAHYLEVSLDRASHPEPVRYWQPALEERSDLSFDEAAAQLRELFLKSVRLHLRSDVPVGSALSGGIDSSSIVMAIRELEPDAEIHSFSYIADQESLSEERWVDMAGQAAGAHVHKVRPTADDLVADLDPLLYFQDEPFGSTTLYAQYRVFRLAHEHGIKVMLDGQGADEILGGYRYYLSARLASLLRQGHWCQALGFLRRCSRLPNAPWSRLAMYSADYLLPAAAQVPFRKLVHREVLPPWINRDWFSRNGVVPDALNHTHSPDVLKQTLCRTLVETSLPGLLRYEDRNSMAFSIESRVPFLTPELVSFVLSLPESYIIANDGTTKSVFRRAMRGLVPDAILDRRDKIGFGTPERKWLSSLNLWVAAVLSSEAARELPFLNVPAAEQEWKAVRDGRRPFDYRVWRWLNTIQWIQQYQVAYD